MIDELPSWDEVDFVRFALLGSAFTLGVDLVLYPLETLKTRMQVERTKTTLFRATVDSFRSVLKEQGLKGFFQGFGIYTFGGLPSQGAYFASYSWAKQWLSELNRRPDGTYLPESLVPVGAGLIADVVAAPLWTPVDVIASRMQIQGDSSVVRYKSTSHAFRSVWKHEGIRGLFRGLSASIVAFGPASAIWFSTYELTSGWLTGRWRANQPASLQDRQHPLWVPALAGLAAGTLSSIITNPLDIAQTRLKTQHAFLRRYSETSEKAQKERAQKEAALRQQRKIAFFKSLKRVGSPLPSAPVEHRPHKQADGGASSTTAVLRHISSSRRLPTPPLPPFTGAPHRVTTAAVAAEALESLPGAAGLKAHRADLPRALLIHVESLQTRKWKRSAAAPQATAAEQPRKPVPPPIAAVLRAEAPYPPPKLALTPYQSRLRLVPNVKSLLELAKGLEGLRMGRKRGPAFNTTIASSSSSSSSASSFARFGSGFFSEIPAPLRDLGSLLKHYYQKPRATTAARTAAGTTSSAGDIVIHDGVWSVLREMVTKEGGARALMRGVVPRVLLAGPASAATFVGYEVVLSHSRKAKMEEGTKKYWE